MKEHGGGSRERGREDLLLGKEGGAAGGVWPQYNHKKGSARRWGVLEPKSTIGEAPLYAHPLVGSNSQDMWSSCERGGGSPEVASGLTVNYAPTAGALSGILGVAKVGLLLWTHETQFIPVLLWIHHCILFQMNTCKPALGPPCILWLLHRSSSSSTWKMEPEHFRPYIHLVN